MADTAMFLGWKDGNWLNGGDQDWLCAGIGVESEPTEIGRCVGIR